MLTLHTYHIRLHLHRPIIFGTFPGFYLRNALVKALARHCREPERMKGQQVVSCKGCGRIKNCLYYKLNLPVEVPEGIPGPMPFSLKVDSLITGKYESGTLEFELVLFGRANHCAGAFKEALVEVGSNYGLGEQGQADSFKIVGFEKTATFDVATMLNAPTEEYNGLQLHFRHLKLSVKRMKSPPRLPLEYLLQMIETRLENLTKCYGEPSVLKKEALTPLNSVKPTTHSEQFALCNYQYTGSGQGHWFLSGKVNFKGEMAQYLNLITIGSILGIGRFTSYGFGSCHIDKFM